MVNILTFKDKGHFHLKTDIRHKSAMPISYLSKNRVGNEGLIPSLSSHTTTHAVRHVAVPRFDTIDSAFAVVFSYLSKLCTSLYLSDSVLFL